MAAESYDLSEALQDRRQRGTLAEAGTQLSQSRDEAAATKAQYRCDP